MMFCATDENGRATGSLTSIGKRGRMNWVTSIPSEGQKMDGWMDGWEELLVVEVARSRGGRGGHHFTSEPTDGCATQKYSKKRAMVNGWRGGGGGGRRGREEDKKERIGGRKEGRVGRESGGRG